MQAHPDGVRFSQDKPNVIVGPNGAGKSALLNALSLFTLSYYVGHSALDRNFAFGDRQSDQYWSDSGRGWDPSIDYLPGLTLEGTAGPALYYRPNHIPGNDHSVAASMMCGYFEEARRYGTLTEKKSSGQQSQALMARVQAALEGTQEPPQSIDQVNWGYGLEMRNAQSNRLTSFTDRRVEALKAHAKTITGTPLILMDEPEQSLDALAEAQLWKMVTGADLSRMQIIVATHSLIPVLQHEKFHIIEAVPGYVDQVLESLDHIKAPESA